MNVWRGESNVFLTMTRRLLDEKRVNGFFIQGAARPPTGVENTAFNHVAFAGKVGRKAPDREMLWGDWLIESLFPTFLYKEHGESLEKLARDPRIHAIEGFEGFSNWNNSFGRMARPRPTVPEGFVIWMLERWRGKYRGMPQYYFDVEYPEWVVEPLVGRPDIPKTGRTSVSCVMGYGFQWLNDAAHITVMLRHLNWSHGWGDVYGAERFLRALCKELGDIPMGNVNIFANSASMDEPQAAKRYLKEMER